MLDTETGVILVDHGSVREEANALLNDIAALYQETTGAPIVEPAHMELAEPTLADALGRCVAAGARTVVVMPYFLFPGRHSKQDIPRMAEAAAAAHPGVRVVVSDALGLDTRLTDLAHNRVLECLAQATCADPGSAH